MNRARRKLEGSSEEKGEIFQFTAIAASSEMVSASGFVMATCWEPPGKAGSTPRVTCTDPAQPFKAFTGGLVAELVALARWTPKLGKAKREVSGGGGEGCVISEEHPSNRHIPT
jgi:hypothetical protein